MLATGNLTAAGSVTASTLGASAATVRISGTYGSVSGIVEGSDDGGTTYFAIQASRVDTGLIDIAAIAVPDNTTRTWSVGAQGLTNLRFRVTAITSGTVAVRITTTQTPAEPTVSALVTTPDTSWVVAHSPGGNVQATCTKAAAAGVRHVCTAVLATVFTTTTTSATPDIVLRDGASGAGTILFTDSLATAATAGSVSKLFLTGLAVRGTRGTAMTWEATSATGASTFQRVALFGYDD